LSGSDAEQAQAILNNPDYFGDMDTDWLDLVLRTGVTQNLDLSVAGGGVNSRYYTSLSYTGQDGTLINTDFQRISGKISLDSDISKYFRLNTNLNFGYTKSNITNGVYGQALYAPPTFAPYNEDGTYAKLELGYDYQGYQNPLAVASCTNQAKTYTFMGSVARMGLRTGSVFRTCFSHVATYIHVTRGVALFVCDSTLPPTNPPPSHLKGLKIGIMGCSTKCSGVYRYMTQRTLVVQEDAVTESVKN